MHSVLRLSLWAAAAAVFAAAGGAVVSARGESLGHQLSHILAEMDHSAALDAEVAASHSLRQQKRELTAELVAGRLSLAEAAEAFQEVEVTYHGDLRYIRHAYPNLPEDEATYCHALQWARRRLPCDPARAAEILAGLRAEFEARFHHAPTFKEPA